MNYLQHKKWELRNLEIIISDMNRDIEQANEQLSKAIIDNDLKMVKYWGARCHKLEKELPLFKWQKDSLKEELEQ